ncbi:unnamed protein product, partial [Meganyctiphanes norvegica]
GLVSSVDINLIPEVAKSGKGPCCDSKLNVGGEHSGNQQGHLIRDSAAALPPTMQLPTSPYNVAPPPAFSQPVDIQYQVTPPLTMSASNMFKTPVTISALQSQCSPYTTLQGMAPSLQTQTLRPQVGSSVPRPCGVPLSTPQTSAPL